MKKTCVIAAAVIGLALAAPVTAHHLSPMTEFVEDTIPADALDAHNAAVDTVLESGVADMGVSASTMDGTVNGLTDGIGEMDPANDGAGSTCSIMTDDVCADTSSGFGQIRSPSIFEGLTP